MGRREGGVVSSPTHSVQCTVLYCTGLVWSGSYRYCRVRIQFAETFCRSTDSRAQLTVVVTRRFHSTGMDSSVMVVFVRVKREGHLDWNCISNYISINYISMPWSRMLSAVWNCKLKKKRDSVPNIVPSIVITCIIVLYTTVASSCRNSRYAHCTCRQLIGPFFIGCSNLSQRYPPRPATCQKRSDYPSIRP